MFTGLLQLFVTDNRDAAGQTRAFLAAGDREAAARRMHTLRSNAGFICALDLMASAGELEKPSKPATPTSNPRSAPSAARSTNSSPPAGPGYKPQRSTLAAAGKGGGDAKRRGRRSSAGKKAPGRPKFPYPTGRGLGGARPGALSRRSATAGSWAA
jgi:hypothetical protein